MDLISVREEFKTGMSLKICLLFENKVVFYFKNAPGVAKVFVYVHLNLKGNWQGMFLSFKENQFHSASSLNGGLR